MKKTLISALALTVGLTAALPVFAFPKAMTGLDLIMQAGLQAGEGTIILARQGHGGGDDDHGDDHGNDHDDDHDDDHGGGGHSSDDSANHDAGGDDNSAGSASGRKKPRIKGGSGCDDAGDVAEHPECR